MPGMSVGGGGGARTIEACREVSMATLRTGTTPASSPTEHRHTEEVQWNTQYVPNPILTRSPLARIGVGVVGQESATIQCTANDPRRSAKLQAKYIMQRNPPGGGGYSHKVRIGVCREGS